MRYKKYTVTGIIMPKLNADMKNRIRTKPSKLVRRLFLRSKGVDNLSSYFTAKDAEQFVFYRIPKALIAGKEYRNISTDAKLLYGLLLDRVGLSARNEWIDEKDRVYIYYTVDAVGEDLNCCKEKACKLFDELEKARLIERKRQGQGKPSRIYVLRFDSEVGKSDFKKYGKPTSGISKSRLQEVGKSGPNNTDIIYNKVKDIYPSSAREEIEERFKEQLDYYVYFAEHPIKKSVVDTMISILADTKESQALTLKIGGVDVPRERIAERFRELNFVHIDYIFDCLEKSKSDIRNIQAYLMTALYNAPVTMDSYYDAKVRHDMADRGFVVSSNVFALPQRQNTSGETPEPPTRKE